MMLAVGNNELYAMPPIGKEATCPNCREKHPVSYGERILEDGTREPSDFLGFVKCTNGSSYIVSIKGRALEVKP